jgi:hypothetical protein
VAEYVARLWQWGPLFVRTTMVYLVVALLIRNVVAYLAKNGGTMEASTSLPPISTKEAADMAGYDGGLRA